MTASHYRGIFASYEYFNKVQSACVDDALYSDSNLVVSGTCCHSAAYDRSPELS